MTPDVKFKMLRRILPAAFFLMILAAPCVALRAAESEGTAEAVGIGTCEELLQIGENPQGSYVLTNDIDMSGILWEPVDFEGTFDGGGHALLNLRVETVGRGRADTYDGNYKVYETYFAGLFGVLKGAEVRNVRLVNLQVAVETDVPCFIGGVAGYSEDSVIRDCLVQGRLELRAHDRMFGVGGIVGFGSGLIEGTDADVTLVCIDTDAGTRDEQFMGGAYAAGYLDLNECGVTIDGYGSEHGYAHNGGMVGMYMLYPKGTVYEGRITNNTVRGRITFFEDNTNRRAYCKELVGEVMNWSFKNSGNSASFERNEVFDYTVDLRPDMCVDATYTETVTEPGCQTFGYTTVTCDGCGYSYTDHYTPYRHTVEEWTVTQKPTLLSAGVQSGVCADCGAVLEEEVPRLEYEEPAATEEPAVTGEGPASGEQMGSEGEITSGERPASVGASASVEESARGESRETEGKSFLEKPILGAAGLLLLLLLVLVQAALRKRGK